MTTRKVHFAIPVTQESNELTQITPKRAPNQSFSILQFIPWHKPVPSILKYKPLFDMRHVACGLPFLNRLWSRKDALSDYLSKTEQLSKQLFGVLSRWEQSCFEISYLNRARFNINEKDFKEIIKTAINIECLNNQHNKTLMQTNTEKLLTLAKKQAPGPEHGELYLQLRRLGKEFQQLLNCTNECLKHNRLMIDGQLDKKSMNTDNLKREVFDEIHSTLLENNQRLIAKLNHGFKKVGMSTKDKSISLVRIVNQADQENELELLTLQDLVNKIKVQTHILQTISPDELQKRSTAILTSVS